MGVIVVLCGSFLFILCENLLVGYIKGFSKLVV